MTTRKTKIKTGAWDAETAMKLSQEAMTRFLPKGLHTEGAYLYSIVEAETQTQAGYIWFNVNESRGVREAFIYDIYVFEPFQGKGYGTRALTLLDEEARKMKVTKIGLHVFGQNDRAFKLYKKNGLHSHGYYNDQNAIEHQDEGSARGLFLKRDLPGSPRSTCACIALKLKPHFVGLFCSPLDICCCWRICSNI
ncbi:GNAT family N-acetyltransferase [Paenibacillus rhizoplanae]